jgi:tRNA-uridine 2-sulfurtransferase
MKKKKVLVWLSWWVDSAVTAHLLLQQWYDVIAGFMKNYSEPDNPHCTTRMDRDMAIKVAEHLGIKTFIIFDFRKEYQERIIDYIYDGYKKWLTPNPDVFCNNLIKFDLFLEQAIKLWCEYIATGHYAIIKDNLLYRGKDNNKDQSYFLSRLNNYQLSHALTPLGEYTKTHIRTIAKEIWLPNADRPDSQWLCFIGNIPMSEFLRKRLPEQPWNIIDQTGKKVGTHQWARFYTLGQRHQLFLPFRAYVTSIDVTNNIVTVWEKYDEKLTSDRVTVTDRVWTGNIENHDQLKECLIKIRYRQDPAVLWSCFFTDNWNLKFKITPTRWVTPGQILVAYTHDEQVIGSGIIL